MLAVNVHPYGVLYISTLKKSSHTDSYWQIWEPFHKHTILVEHHHYLESIYRILLESFLDICLFKHIIMLITSNVR